MTKGVTDVMGATRKRQHQAQPQKTEESSRGDGDVKGVPYTLTLDTVHASPKNIDSKASAAIMPNGEPILCVKFQ